MNHEARMKMYHKLLENKNYRKLKILEDLKQFLDDNEYDYIKNNIGKYSSATTRSIAIKVYRTLFKIEKLECPVCGYKVKTDGFHRYLPTCPECNDNVHINIVWSSRDEKFDFTKFLDKIQYMIKNVDYRKMTITSFINKAHGTYEEIKYFFNHFERFNTFSVLDIVNGCPVCKMCFKSCGYRPTNEPKKYCSVECKHSDPDYVKPMQQALKENKEEIIAKTQETNLKKYGHVCPLHSEYGKEKSKETSLKNWGTEHPSQSSIVQHHIKEGNFKRFGCWSSQAPKIKEKIKNTNNGKYGVDHFFQSKEFKERSKETSLKNWGTKNPMQNPIIQEKFKGTCIEKYGTPCPFQSTEVQMKIKDSRYQGNLIPGTKEYNLEVYGTDNPEEDLGVKHIDQYYDKKFIESKFTLNNGTFDFQSYLEYFNITFTAGYAHKKKLGIEIPNRYTTQGSIVDFIKELGFEVLENDRKAIAPMELDIYIPEKNLAIEYHGLMFHSIGKSKYSKFNNYGTKREEQLKVLCHKKADLCDQKGIKLLQIFENEWLEHEEIWKSIIKKELGIYETVPIEYTIFTEINRTQAQEFLESNWIYDINYTSSRALLYAGNIVAVMLTDQNGYTRIIEHRVYRLLNLDKILKGKKVLVDRRLGGFLDLDLCTVSKFHLEPKCYGFNENNIILQETIDSQSTIDQGNRVIWDAGYIVLEF